MDDIQLEQIETVIAESNALAKAESRRLLGNRKYKKFRQMLRNGQVDADCSIMLAVEEHKNDLIEQFLPMISLLAKTKAKRTTNADVQDLINAGVICLYDAIYGYTDTSNSFHTYAYHVVRRGINRYVMQNSSKVSATSSEYQKLLREVLDGKSHATTDSKIQSVKIAMSESVSAAVAPDDTIDPTENRLDVHEMMNRSGLVKQEQAMLLEWINKTGWNKIAQCNKMKIKTAKRIVRAAYRTLKIYAQFGKRRQEVA